MSKQTQIPHSSQISRYKHHGRTKIHSMHEVYIRCCGNETGCLPYPPKYVTEVHRTLCYEPLGPSSDRSQTLKLLIWTWGLALDLTSTEGTLPIHCCLADKRRHTWDLVKKATANKLTYKMVLYITPIVLYIMISSNTNFHLYNSLWHSKNKILWLLKWIML